MCSYMNSISPPLLLYIFVNCKQINVNHLFSAMPSFILCVAVKFLRVLYSSCEFTESFCCFTLVVPGIINHLATCIASHCIPLFSGNM